MREEILLFLSDSFEYKLVNGFLSEKYNSLSLESIRSNLTEMKEEKVIDLSGDYNRLGGSNAGVIIDLKNTQLFARITQKGRLELKPSVPTQSIQIEGGVHNSNLNQSSSSLNESINPVTQISSKAIANTPIKRSRLEKLYWIAGIIIALIAIWQIVAPHILNTPNSIGTTKQKIEYPRHFTELDLQRIALVTNDTARIIIFYNGTDTETVNFANEMYNKLKPIYNASLAAIDNSKFSKHDEEKFSLSGGGGAISISISAKPR
jgi:hypothetical protein